MEMLLDEVLESQRETRKHVDELAKEMRSGHDRLALLVSRREVDAVKNAARASALEYEIHGDENNSGLKATVSRHESRINWALGASTVLIAVGGVIGWFIDKIILIAKGIKQ